MIIYLLRKYIWLMLVIAGVMTAFPMVGADVSLRQALPRGVLWSGFLAAGIVYYEFKRLNLWPLYDNLRLSRFMLLGGLAAVNVFLFVVLTWWMR